jgi:serine/threonine-protein kinase
MGNASKRAVEVGDLVEGRYRIIKILGEGGMGTVFLAEHTLIKRKVAIKILHPQFASDAEVVERFMNEARAAGTLGHPNIVESTDMGFTHDHVPYIVLEYLEGALLTDEIYRVGGLPMRRAVRIAEQIANALRAAHDAGIVHRDLKSDNVFLTDKDEASDHVKVLDFGISRFMEVEEQRGLVMGTPEFMAPEQITHPDAVDRRADVYALGVILYEMLTARRPFTAGKDTQELQRKIVSAPPPPLERDVPRALSELILDKMLAKDPADRPQTMSAVQAALEAFITRSDGTPLPRRRSEAIAAVNPDDIARNSGTIPSPQAMIHTPYPNNPMQSMQMVAVQAPAAKKHHLLYAATGFGLALGVAGLVIGLRAGGHADAPAPVAPAPAASIAMPAPAPKAEPAKIAVTVDSDIAGARVVFRRRLAAAPMKAEIAATDIVEMVEVTAPGYKTERYWLTFDRDTHLKAHLGKGTGIEEASEEQTLVALGELSAPTPAGATTAAREPAKVREPKPAETRTEPAAKPVEVAAVAAPTTVMARRKIGRAAAEASPDTTVAVETVSRGRGSTAAAIEAAPAPVAVAMPTPPKPAEPAKTEATPEPAWVKSDSAPSTEIAAAPAAKPMPPTVLPPATLKSLLVTSGTIAPPEIVQTQMMRDEKKKTGAVVKVCVGAGGEVTSSSIAKSSGYPEYDTKLVTGVRAWRYRPYMVNGQYVPVCSAIAFAFSIQ